MKTVRIKCLEYPLEGIYNSSLGKFVIYYDKNIPVVVKIQDVDCFCNYNINDTAIDKVTKIPCLIIKEYDEDKFSAVDIYGRIKTYSSEELMLSTESKAQFLADAFDHGHFITRHGSFRFDINKPCLIIDENDNPSIKVIDESFKESLESTFNWKLVTTVDDLKEKYISSLIS